MNEWILILTGIILILVILGILLSIVFLKRKQEIEINEEPNYQAFFIMGISFLPLGILFTIAVSPAFIGFIGIGICYIAIGLANKHKWKKEE